MASPSSNETFVIIRQDKHGRPHEIIRHNTDEGAHVASAIRICREVLKNPKVKTVFEGIVEDLEAPSELWYKDKAKDKVVDLFIDKIMQHFPYVFVDPSLTNPAVRGCHWRHVGAEGYDFDPHKQSIVINGVVSRNGRHLASSSIE